MEKGAHILNKNVWIWSIISILIILSLPGLYNRWAIETKNTTYEMVTPFEEIAEVANKNALNIEDVLTLLQDAGLTSVSLSPFSLIDLERQGLITIYDEEELKNKLRFTNYYQDVPNNQHGYYFTRPESPVISQMLIDVIKPATVTIGDESLFFLNSDSSIKLSTKIGYDEQAIKRLQSQGLQYIFKIENDTSDKAEEHNRRILNQLIDLKTDHNPNLLFTGIEIMDYLDKTNMVQFIEQLSAIGYRFYTIEFAEQKGMKMLARHINYDVVRLHSMDLDHKPLEEQIDQAVRAVKERNIRSIFFHIPVSSLNNELEYTAEFISGVINKMPQQFSTGIAEPFERIDINLYVTLSLLIAGILFIYLAISLWNNRKLSLLSTLVLCLLALVYFVTENLVFLQAIALVIAIITPIYAVLSTYKIQSNRLIEIVIQYLKALGISLIGIMITTGLLNGNSFITGFEIFRGVKLVYLTPLLLLIVILFWKWGFKFLTSQVKYWHLLVIFIIGTVGYYYISRTGNAGAVSSIEIMIRNTLEDLLYVRPRTKEVLIGFPFYLLALYALPFNKVLGKILLIPGIIGFISIVNTFTHFHIPLYISLLRTAYSAIFGFTFGVVLIYLFKLCLPWFSKILNKRWS